MVLKQKKMNNMQKKDVLEPVSQQLHIQTDSASNDIYANTKGTARKLSLAY